MSESWRKNPRVMLCRLEGRASVGDIMLACSAPLSIVGSGSEGSGRDDALVVLPVA